MLQDRNHRNGILKNGQNKKCNILWKNVAFLLFTYIIGGNPKYFRGFWKNFFLQSYLGVHFILVVLVDAQISFRNLIRGMVIDCHEQGGGRSLFPGMVSEGLPQGVAADIGVRPGEGRCPLNDAEGLETA